jgi:hypothetical protein
LDGRHRADVLRNLGAESATCVVWDVGDDEAMVLLATLNRLEGADVPARRASLIQELADHRPLAELAELLPETEAELASSLQSLEFDLETFIEQLDGEADDLERDLPELFSFAVDRDDVPLVEQALDRAAAQLTGRNRRGQALVALARNYLDAGNAGA